MNASEHESAAARLDHLARTWRVAIDERRETASSLIAFGAVGSMPVVLKVVRRRGDEWRCGEVLRALAESGDHQIDESLVRRARQIYHELCETQATPRLLHGDLQHENVLYDRGRGWVAIDPKGVVGELSFEVGPLLRNPARHTALIADPSAVERRVRRFASQLGLDADRVLRWGFAQAALSAIWAYEDDEPIAPTMVSLRLAEAIRQLMSLE